MTIHVETRSPLRSFVGGLPTSRTLTEYPSLARRASIFAVVLLISISGAYQFYVISAVAPVILQHLHMSLTWLSNSIVAAGLVGAISSYLAGVADRIGRANVIVFSTLLVSLITVIGIPATSGSKLGFTLIYMLIGFLDAVGWVAVPSLARDFSPSVGRSTIMGFTIVGIVAGTWVASTVVAHTSHLTYVTEYEIAGISGLVMSVVGVFTVRELAPALRAQTLVTEEDGSVASARVRRGSVDDKDAERRLPGRWRQITRNPYIWGMAIGSNVFLLLYIIATGFSTVYYTSVLHFSLATANGINTFFFGIACASNVVFGIVADRVRVRKPVYLAGWAIALAFAILFATERHPSFAVVTTTVSIMVAAMAMSTTQYYAALSERLEHINPMAVAAGFGLANIVARAIQGISLLVFPHVVGANYTDRNGWDIWFWAGIVCIAVALPLVLPGIMGRWSPRRAMAELDQHRLQARVELSSLEVETLTARPVPVAEDASRLADPARSTGSTGPGR